ncbi:HD domain-containing protein [Candidatus Kaiserbacteria bacterium]|nr:HD domain-containing protein [Candidatus Kaiserbacteria bacterium]
MSESLGLISDAIRLATRAHQGQTRKEDDTPYIVHPYAVALELARYGFPDTVIAAALAHDVVEDTKVTAEELRGQLGDEVADIVAALTQDDSLSWEEKKKKYIETVRNGPDSVKAVATADKAASARDLLVAHAAQGPAVWKHFNAGREKKLWFENAMLSMLQKSWNHALVDEYAALVEKLNTLA